METKFEVGQELDVLVQPGWTGTVVLIDVYAKKYLLDCHPVARGGCVWYKVPTILLRYPGGILAGNWFAEDQLRAVSS